MSSQPIKSFITIHNIDQTTRLDSATNEQVVNSYQCTEPAASALASLIEQARSGSIAVITGVRGAGKSHLLAFLRAVITQPDLIQKISHPFARRILEKAVDKRPRSQTMVTINCDSEQTDVNLLSTRGEAQIEAACATGKNVFVFIDGLSLLLKRSKREECLQWLVTLAHNADAQRYQLFITLDQDLLDILLKAFSTSQILSAIETLPTNNLALVLDQFICPKKPEQKRALDNLYDELCRKVPHFQWSHQDFLQAFPLHPQVLELAPALRTYARTFSLLSFFYTVAPRAIMRRGFNLISLVEVFDTFEYDLRRNTALSYLFSTYDYLLDNFVKALPSIQQFHGKFLLRAITLLSLKEKSYTSLEIADSVMLFDDSPSALFRQSMKTIMDFMATAASEKMVISMVDGEKKFQLCLAKASVVDPIEEATKAIEDDDSRLIETLIDSGKQNFKDWPLVFSSDNVFQRRSEMELIWRGTTRRGIIKLGGSTEVSSNNSKQKNLEWQLTLVSPSSIDQYRTEVPENLVARYWFPAPLQPDELSLLKRLLVIHQQGHNLLSPEELQAEDSYLTSQAAKIFSRCYLENGSLGNAQQNTAQSFSYQEKRLPNLLGSMLDPILKNKFSKHPILGDILNERTLKVLARGFFYQSEWSRPELKKYLGQFALPLHIVSLVGENFEFSLTSDIPKDSPLGKILNALERSYAQTINRVDIERLLCNDPFGLQQTLLLLLALGAAAAGHIILTDNFGEVILTSAGIRSGYDVANYTKVCLPSILQSQEESDPILPLKAESKFNNLQENVLKEAVADVLSNTPITKAPKTTKEDDEQLLEFYQSGVFSRPAISNEPTIKSSTTTDLPSITRTRKPTTGEAAKVPPLEEPLAESTETGEEDELLEFYQSGSFQRPIIPDDLDKPIEKTPIKLTNSYLRPITENVKPLQEIVPQIKTPTFLENRNSISSSDFTPLVISKSLLNSDLALEEMSKSGEEIQSLELRTSSAHAFTNADDLTQETNANTSPEVNVDNNLVSQESNNISSVDIAFEQSSDIFSQGSVEETPSAYQFDFNINTESKIDIDSNLLTEPPAISLSTEEPPQTNEFLERANVAANLEAFEPSLVNISEPHNEFNELEISNELVNTSEVPNEFDQEFNLIESEVSQIFKNNLLTQESPALVEFSSVVSEETSSNVLVAPKQEVEDLVKESEKASITEDGRFAFDIDSPKTPVKSTIDIEKALASFEAERDRLANAPTLSELPIIDDIPDPDPNILDLDLSSEALKETRKIPIVKVSPEYFQPSHDGSFEPISPNHPTIKLPAVPFLEEDKEDIPEEAKDFGKIITLSEVNKITDQLPNLPPLPEEELEQKVAVDEPPKEVQQPTFINTSKEIQETEADDIYLDPFTGVFEAITFPEEEESGIPASLLVNKFATQTSLPTVDSGEPFVDSDSTQSNVSAEPLERGKLDVPEDLPEPQAFIQEVNQPLDYGAKLQTSLTEENPTLDDMASTDYESSLYRENSVMDDMASAPTESEIMTPEIISQLANQIEKENIELQNLVETPQTEETQGLDEIENQIQQIQEVASEIKETPKNTVGSPSSTELSLQRHQSNLNSKLLDVSLDLNELNNLMIAEQQTEETLNNQSANPFINKSALDFVIGKTDSASKKIETPMPFPNASLFTPEPSAPKAPSPMPRPIGEHNIFSPIKESPSTQPERRVTGEQKIPTSGFPLPTSPIPPFPSPRFTGEQKIIPPPFGISPPTQTPPPPRTTGEQARLNPFSPLSNLPSAVPSNEANFAPPTPLIKQPIKEKSLGDLLLGNTIDSNTTTSEVSSSLNAEPSPIEYVPDGFVFSEKSFNIPAPVKPSIMETLPATTLSAEALPNEIILGNNNLNTSLSPTNQSANETFDIFSLPTVSSGLSGEKADKWFSPETESDFGFDTIMDDMEVEANAGSGNERVPQVKHFSPPPAPPPAIASKMPLGLNQYSSITQSPTVDMSSPVAAKISTPTNNIVDSSLPKNQLVMSRKFNNDIIAARELAILYEKFTQVCQSYKVPNAIPSEEQFRVTVLNISKSLKAESLSSEILCSLEIVEGEVHVYCQANRASLFQKRSQRQRVF